MATDFKQTIESLIREIKGCAIDLYREIGPGYDDFLYEACLCRLLHQAGLSYIRLKALPFILKGELIEDCLPRVQLIIEDLVFLEVNSEMGMPILDQEIEICLNRTKKNIALYINFNQPSEERLFRRINRLSV
jgi:GxxExxY protein